MKIFKINEKIEVVCNYEKTRSGFRHLATMFVDGVEFAKGKCCYQNRTWESYEFQSVLYTVVEKSDLSKEDKTVCEEFIREGKLAIKEIESQFNTIGIVAKMGEVFCDTQKEKNDWKVRMLKAGLENKGLIMPEDWESLDENIKEERLNKMIEFMGDVK